MGNNHDKYFGKEKRKILVLGLPDSGKTTLLEMIVEGKQPSLKVQKTKDLNIRDADLAGLSVTFFDLAGGERQRIFWKQHYEGTQGLIFLIDSTSSDDSLQTALQQLQKTSKSEHLGSIPLAICLHKSDAASPAAAQLLNEKVSQRARKCKLITRVFTTNMKQPGKVKEMVGWLLKESKPL